MPACTFSTDYIFLANDNTQALVNSLFTFTKKHGISPGQNIPGCLFYTTVLYWSYEFFIRVNL